LRSACRKEERCLHSLRAGGFSPETLELLDRAFSATWRELQLRRSSSASRENEQATRKAIAKSIIDLAAAGVREPERLKRHALHAAEREPADDVVHLPD
jgi:hypothetical protein